MKITKVKWKNHPILGDLELDFTASGTGIPFETVIFAGENGTGKTSILDSLSTFLNAGSFEYFEYLEYIINNEVFEAKQPTSPTSIKSFFQLYGPGTEEFIASDRFNGFETISSNYKDLRGYGCVFSKARADYRTEKIGSTTTKKLDIDKYDKDDEDDFTSIKQLLVDIQSQDSDEYRDLNKGLGDSPETWDNFYITSKTYRFKNAFDTFFEKITFDKVEDIGDEKTIQFTKAGKTISIDGLSTGEKQIVFRGSYLLKNNKNLSGGAIMIDEPELSMHPKWQKKILKYYKDLFTENETQNVQLFIATHSEYVVSQGLSDPTNSLVIVLAENNGVINAKRIDAPSVLPTITSAETNYLAFDVVSNDYHIELYGWLQVRENKTKVKSCDEYIKNHAAYDAARHQKPWTHRVTYDTLSTYIRNAIDHPDPTRTFADEELRTSTELLIQILR